ncbi:MAG: transcription repressor NadR [Oscillospiraceae bacterium]|nr:transcription repressor NadR [Oscillospiraceae bacterium]
MNAETRRKKIVEHLSRSAAPVSATVLAGIFSVSRQVIVGDIALLRAAGEDITATPRGYVLTHEDPGMTRTVAVKHSVHQTAEELYIFVDNGCIVEDVIVEHHIYGQLIGQLQLASRYDVGQFLDRLERGSANVLSSLTDGIHLHTLRCPDEAAFDRACLALKEAGLLLEQEE